MAGVHLNHCLAAIVIPRGGAISIKKPGTVMNRRFPLEPLWPGFVCRPNLQKPLALMADHSLSE